MNRELLNGGVQVNAATPYLLEITRNMDLRNFYGDILKNHIVEGEVAIVNTFTEGILSSSASIATNANGLPANVTILKKPYSEVFGREDVTNDNYNLAAVKGFVEDETEELVISIDNERAFKGIVKDWLIIPGKNLQTLQQQFSDEIQRFVDQAADYFVLNTYDNMVDICEVSGNLSELSTGDADAMFAELSAKANEFANKNTIYYKGNMRSQIIHIVTSSVKSALAQAQHISIGGTTSAEGQGGITTLDFLDGVRIVDSRLVNVDRPANGTVVGFTVTYGSVFAFWSLFRAYTGKTGFEASDNEWVGATMVYGDGQAVYEEVLHLWHEGIWTPTVANLAKRASNFSKNIEKVAMFNANKVIVEKRIAEYNDEKAKAYEVELNKQKDLMKKESSSVNSNSDKK